MKADAGGRELFSGFHFGMDDWGNWRLNCDVNDSEFLSVFTGPVAVALFLLLIGAWWKLRCLEHEKKTLIAKNAQLEERNADFPRQLTEAGAVKDTEIQKGQKEIEKLHKELDGCTQTLNLYRGDSLTHDKIVNDLKAEVARLNAKISTDPERKP
jgi:hypothetical protein